MANQKKEDKGFFTQLPIVLIDEYSDKMPATSFVGFVRFYRHYGHRGIFKGSIRKLCNVLGMAIGSVYRAIGDWVKCGLVRKGEQKKMDENRDEMVLLIEGNDLWRENIEYSKSFRECSRLEQSAFAEESTVPENKGSVPDWNVIVPDRDKSVPSLNDFVPASSSKSGEYITEDNNKITLDKTEDRGETPESPTSQQPNASFLPSSDLNLLISSQDSGLRIASQSDSSQNLDKSVTNSDISPTNSENSSGVETPHSDIPSGQGYKTSNSETPDSGAVMKNSTELDQLRFWLKELRIQGSSDATKKAADLAEILPFVKSLEDMASLHAYAEAELLRRYGEYRKAYLGNMAAGVKGWVKSQSPQAPHEEEYAPSPQGMTLEERDELVNGALACCPDLVINGTLEAPYFVAISVSDDRVIEMEHPDDWARSNPSEWLWQAAEFGARYWQQQAEREAIAV